MNPVSRRVIDVSLALLLLAALGLPAVAQSKPKRARLYQALVLNTPASSGPGLQKHYLVLLPDGRAHRGMPPRGLGEAELQLLQASGPENWGRWRETRDGVNIKWRQGGLWRLKSRGDILRYGKRQYEPLWPVPPASLEGTWTVVKIAARGEAAQRTSRITFTGDGHFLATSATKGSPAKERGGRYRVDDHTLRLESEGRPPIPLTIYRIGRDKNRIGIGTEIHRRHRKRRGRNKLSFKRLKGPDVLAPRGSLNGAVLSGDIKEVKQHLDAGADIEQTDNRRWTPLHNAALLGHIDIARLLLDRGAKLESLTSTGDTPLRHAVYSFKAEMTRFLLEQGARADRRYKDGFDPLLYCLKARRFGMALSLARHDARIDGTDKMRYGVLHLAVDSGSPELIETLINRGAPLEARNRAGETPLHRAVLTNQPEAVKLLVKHGAALDAKTRHGRTPLEFATKIKKLRPLIPLLQAKR